MPRPTEWVRVRLDNGSHKSIPRAAAEQAGLKPLKQGATDRAGSPLPTKPRILTRSDVESAATPEVPTSPDASKED